MTYISNHKAAADYEILEKYEAGIELIGSEVKSIRASHGSLQGSYIIVRGAPGKRGGASAQEAFIKNSYIPPYQENNSPADYDAYRDRRLILGKSQIAKLASEATAKAGSKSSKGLTIIPISMYNKGRVIKVEIALVRGRQKHDKRASLRKKAVDRDLERELN